MTATAAVRRATPLTTNYRQTKRFSRSMPAPQKPLYQAVLRPFVAERMARIAAPNCINLGLFICPLLRFGWQLIPAETEELGCAKAVQVLMIYIGAVHFINR